MEIKWLEDFLCLADTRSFSRAAADRHITQSAFSRRIMALEEWLNAELVDRSVQPARLTSAGWLFRRIAADLLRDAYAARTLLGGYQPLAEPEKVVQFAVAHTLVFTLFPNWLKKLHEAFGPLLARVEAVNVPQGVQQLVEGECDLLLAYHHPQLPIVLDPNQYPHLRLGVERILPFSAAGEDGQPLFRLPGTATRPLPFLAYSAGAFIGTVVEMIRLNARTESHLHRTFETHMSEALKAMLVAGHGVGWLPESCVATELREGRLAIAGSTEWTTQLEVRLHRAPLPSHKPVVDELWNWLCTPARP